MTKTKIILHIPSNYMERNTFLFKYLIELRVQLKGSTLSPQKIIDWF